MSAEANRNLVQRYLNAISGKAKPPEVVTRFVDDPSLEEHVAIFEAAFPSYELIADDVVAERDIVALRATFRGRHKSEFQGIPASGREVVIPVTLFYRIAAERIVEHWLLADSLSLLQQLDAIPSSEPRLEVPSGFTPSTPSSEGER